MNRTTRTLRSLLLLALIVTAPWTMAAGIQYAKTAAATLWPSGFASADNLLLRSDGTTGAIQDSGITVSDGDALSGLTGITSTGTLQVPAIKGGTTSSVSATYGVTLPDDARLVLGETGDNTVIIGFGSTPSDTGFGNSTYSSKSYGWFVGGVKGGSFASTGIYPGANGTKANGTTTLSWDDTYTDDLFLQMTTPASEGKIHWEGAAGDSSMGVHPVKADGTAPASAADAVALSVKLAASPGSGESVEALRVSTTAVTVINSLSLQASGVVANLGFVSMINNGVSSIGSATGAVNNFWVDNVYLQQTTAGEATLNFEGVAGNDTASIKIRKNDGTAATPYDSVSVFLPGSPALPSSVEASRHTTTDGLVLPLGLLLTARAAPISQSSTAAGELWMAAQTVGAGCQGDELHYYKRAVGWVSIPTGTICGAP